jgi:hypothetical protein
LSPLLTVKRARAAAGVETLAEHAFQSVAGVAERRFRGTYLRCEAIDVDGSLATVRHRAIAEHVESSGVLLESLVVGWYGAAVPVGMSERAFAELLAGASHPIREETDRDDA